MVFSHTSHSDQLCVLLECGACCFQFCGIESWVLSVFLVGVNFYLWKSCTPLSSHFQPLDIAYLLLFLKLTSISVNVSRHKLWSCGWLQGELFFGLEIQQRPMQRFQSPLAHRLFCKITTNLKLKGTPKILDFFPFLWWSKYNHKKIQEISREYSRLNQIFSLLLSLPCLWILLRNHSPINAVNSGSLNFLLNSWKLPSI